LVALDGPPGALFEYHQVTERVGGYTSGVSTALSRTRMESEEEEQATEE
jgi:hypothetical protein